jgi:hypothetical protein
MEAAAAAAIDAALAHHGARPGDRALSQAAAGGDILFLEACQKRGLRCEVLLPFDRDRFLDRSVRPSADGDRWVERFRRVIDDPDTTLEEMPGTARMCAGRHRPLRALQSVAARSRNAGPRRTSLLHLPVER